jgi:hypothetical protein
MRSRVRVLIVVIALAAGSACGADTSFGPGSRSDLNQVFNEWAIVRNFFAMSWSKPVFTAALTLIPVNCPYAAATQSFNCPPQTLSGLTVTQSYTLLGASGAPQAAFDAARTAAVRISNAIAGTITVNGGDLTVSEGESLTLSGLLTGKHTVDGTNTMQVGGTRLAIDAATGATIRTPINTTITTTVTGIVLPPTLTVIGAPAVPLSGNITVNNRTSVSGQPAIFSSAVFPFDGSNTVVAIITVDGVTHTCPVALVGTTYSLCL